MKNSEYWKNKWVFRPTEPANNFAVRAYKLIKRKKLKTLLDLGCGDGRDSIYFFNKGLKVRAVDFSFSGINTKYEFFFTLNKLVLPPNWKWGYLEA